jgi:hypothetical protein
MADTIYGSRDRNPFNVPKTFKVNGVDTKSNIKQDRKFYPLVDSVTGDITIKEYNGIPSSAGGNTSLDRTIGTIPKDNSFQPVQGQTTFDEIAYFNSAEGQKAVKNHAVITAQKAGAQNAQQLIFPNSATPGAGQGQNIPPQGGEGATPAFTKEQIEEDIKKEKSQTRNQFRGAGGTNPLVYPITLRSDKQDIIKFKMLQYKPRPLNIGSTLNPIGERRTGETNIIGTVILPIPAGISDRNSVTWGEDPLNPLQAAAVDAVNSFITQGGAAAAERMERGIGAAQQNSSDLKLAFATQFTQAITGTSNILSRTTGAITNPNLELLFSAPTLRPFSFVFKLSARSKKEAETIRSIIRFFKQGMSPIRTESQLFLKAPHTFQLQYLHRNEPHSYLNKFKECALQSFSVDYTPEGQYATFTDGAMVSYQITMEFTELEPIFNDDYKNAENAPDTEIGF